MYLILLEDSFLGDASFNITIVTLIYNSKPSQISSVHIEKWQEMDGPDGPQKKKKW
jgi:hypothetical protein